MDPNLEFLAKQYLDIEKEYSTTVNFTKKEKISDLENRIQSLSRHLETFIQNQGNALPEKALEEIEDLRWGLIHMMSQVSLVKGLREGSEHSVEKRRSFIKEGALKVGDIAQGVKQSQKILQEARQQPKTERRKVATTWRDKQIIEERTLNRLMHLAIESEKYQRDAHKEKRAILAQFKNRFLEFKNQFSEMMQQKNPKNAKDFRAEVLLFLTKMNEANLDQYHLTISERNDFLSWKKELIDIGKQLGAPTSPRSK